MRINWIGQSGYLLDDGKKRILIDPYLSDIVNRVASRPRLVEAPFQAKDFSGDAVVCTHDHLDHLDPESITDFDKKMLFIAPPSCKAHLKELGCKKIKTINIGNRIKIGSFSMMAVPAFHTIEAIGLLVEWKGIRLYFTSDTLYDKRLEEMQKFKPDILFICINGKLGNMDVGEAIMLTKAIHPRVGIPTHYGMFESNTEDPKKYTTGVTCGFEMEYNKFYDINDILGESK